MKLSIEEIEETFEFIDTFNFEDDIFVENLKRRS